MADRRLQVFHAVAKHQSFTRAARALFMAQSSVTNQVRQLELQYGTRLFERERSAVTLTPAGEIVMAYAEKILALGDELDTRLAEMSGEMRGTLQLGACGVIADFMLAQLLNEFNALYPQVRVLLQVVNSTEIERLVAANRLDLGLIERPPSLAGVVGQDCGMDDMVVICAPDYPLVKFSKVAPKQLVDYEYLCREPGSGSRALAEAYFASHRVPVESLKIQMELGSLESLKALVATGLGYAIVSRTAVVQDAAQGRLAVLTLNPALRHPLYLVQAEDRFRSRLVSTFAQFVREKLGDMTA